MTGSRDRADSYGSRVICRAPGPSDQGSGDGRDGLDALPRRYATAIRLARRGMTPAGIAAELGIPAESLAGVLVLAEARLMALRTGRGGATDMDEGAK